MNKKISVIGGDLRQIKAASCLKEHGFDVLLTGFDEDKIYDKTLSLENDIHKSIEFADILVFPLPMAYDETHMNTPLYEGDYYVVDTLKLITKNELLLAGMISPKFQTLLNVYGIYAIDYYQRDEIQILNAVPTAEGAIEIAMRELPVTLHDSRALVIGYGRIGKILAKMLGGIGAHVTASARKCADIASISAYSHEPVYTKDIKSRISEFDVIFNTVPSCVLDRQTLEQVRPDTVIIDLASKPGGVDFEAAKELGLNVIWALSLPGKVAPITAGKIITDTILNIIGELGV